MRWEQTLLSFSVLVVLHRPVRTTLAAPARPTVGGRDSTDRAAMLHEVPDYVEFLRLQVKVQFSVLLSMKHKPLFVSAILQEASAPPSIRTIKTVWLWLSSVE